MGNGGFDLQRAKLLIDEISRNLAALPADSARHAELRAEVDALKALLDRPGAQPAIIEGRMKTVHGLFEAAGAELRADGIRAGVLLREIGRMLGLD
jgi:hypothetical protein